MPASLESSLPRIATGGKQRVERRLRIHCTHLETRRGRRVLRGSLIMQSAAVRALRR